MDSTLIHIMSMLACDSFPFFELICYIEIFRYKVKVTPGTGKRGKAAKSAIHMFLQAKESTDWEKDLLKSLKVCFDQLLANIKSLNQMIRKMPRKMDVFKFLFLKITHYVNYSFS